ncbi:MAG TPA: nitroreductase family protein [Nitrososphaerales archaeon]|nr:nitroreductase family protein [Nitrososphaerales archaeon]
MDAYECISSKLEVREFAEKPVPDSVKAKILEAARLTQSSMNTQHWRFVVVENKKNLETLSEDSVTGPWVSASNFAVLVLTDPRLSIHLLDIGRVVQDMQLAAWNYGVASGVYTGFNKEAMSRDFKIPEDLRLVMVVAFGYPSRKILGRKNRKPLEEIAFSERYGDPLRLKPVQS